MLTSITFTSVAGLTVDFQTDTLSTKTLTFSGDTRNEDRPRMQMHGRWPTFTEMDGLILHHEGDVLYNDPAQYVVARLDLMKKLFGDLQVPPTERRLGRLFLRYTGMAEPMYADVTVDGRPELPMEAIYFATTPYLINWKTFVPYFIGVATGVAYNP